MLVHPLLPSGDREKSNIPCIVEHSSPISISSGSRNFPLTDELSTISSWCFSPVENNRMPYFLPRLLRASRRCFASAGILLGASRHFEPLGSRPDAVPGISQCLPRSCWSSVPLVPLKALLNKHGPSYDHEGRGKG